MIQAAILTLCFVGAALAIPDGIHFKVNGGSAAAPGQYPFMVSVRSRSSHACGGSLIAPDWVVTAAHCVYGGQPSSYKVVAGSNTLSSGGTEVAVLEIRMHPKYDSWDSINDIALLQLVSPIQKTSSIQIIPLETTNDDSVRNVTVIGWGTTSFPDGSTPNNLQYLPLKTITYNECKSMMSSSVIVPSEICTLTKKGEGVCHGDAGSPLVGKRNETTTLVGNVSWRKPCAKGYPDVYTRVSSFIGWIEDETELTFS